MFDINFFRQVEELKKEVTSGNLEMANAPELIARFERIRRKQPTVFSIETTNICNMRCVMCPRTELMDRPLMSMAPADFNRILDQIQPHSGEQLREFWKFVQDRYEIDALERSENAFYFYVVSRCLTLHGYGEPLLDPHIVSRVAEATARGIPSYFSCVPANLTVERASALMRAGLTVLKVSIDALDDKSHQAIRGSRSNFTASFQTVLNVLEERKRLGSPTLIVPTLIALSDAPAARDVQVKFIDLWRDHDVFAYVKSQDNRWFFEEEENMANRSHYDKQYCEFPWTSLSVMANGEVVPCCQDYNVEMSFGNIRENTLEEIWNNHAYRQFREWHVTGAFPSDHKCLTRCDQKKAFQYLRAAPEEVVIRE